MFATILNVLIIFNGIKLVPTPALANFPFYFLAENIYFSQTFSSFNYKVVIKKATVKIAAAFAH